MSAMDLTLRIRTQIGMWRIHEVNRSDTIGDVKRRLEKEHNIDLTHCPLTREPSKEGAESSSSIYRESMTVSEAQLTNGQILHLRIDETLMGVHEASGTDVKKKITKDGNIVTQDIEHILSKDGFRPGMLPLRSMKMQWTLDEFMIMDSQFVYKIKAPEEGKGAICSHATVDTSSLNNFQLYMRNFDFRVMRMAFLYGTFQEDNSAKVELVYEPPQETTAISFVLLDDPKADHVEGLASMLGLQKVGWLFAHPAREAGFHFSGPEIMFAAEQQLEAAGGVNDTPFVTIKMTVDEKNLTVTEAYQVSKQCMEMVAEEILGVSTNLGRTSVNPSYTAVVEGKDAKEIDNNFFLVTVPIKQFDGEMLVSQFPRVNRVDTLQMRSDIADQLKKEGKNGWTFIQLLADFQLLLFLSDFLGFADDMPRVCKCVTDREVPLDAGYALLIRSIAGLDD